MTKIKRAFALVVLCMAAACGGEDDFSSGNAFCDSYGDKLQALACSSQPYGDAAASACAMVIAGETKCAAQYQAILTCQTTTSTCKSDGSVEFGACPAESDAYGRCHIE